MGQGSNILTTRRFTTTMPGMVDNNSVSHSNTGSGIQKNIFGEIKSLFTLDKTIAYFKVQMEQTWVDSWL